MKIGRAWRVTRCAAGIFLSALCFFMLFSTLEAQLITAKTTLGEIDSQIRSLEDELEKAAEAREKASEAYENVKEEYENIRKRKEAIDTEIDAIDKEAETLRALVIGYHEQTAILNKKIAKMESELEGRLSILRERLRLNYEDGQADYFTLLFSSDGLYDFLTSADRLSYLIEHDQKLIEECEDACQQLEAEQERLDGILLSSEEKSEELRISLRLLQDKQDEVLKMMTDLEADTNAAQKALLEAEAEEDAFRKKLEQRLAERAEITGSAYVGGDFIWPLPAKYKKVSSSFGNRIHPVTGKPQFHQGIDIPAPNGTEIYCVNRGTVIETGNDYANGKYVIVDHGGGISTMYAHLSKIQVKTGDILAQGEVLGLVGMTGYATGYHLHISVYENGKAVDPLTYLPN